MRAKVIKIIDQIDKFGKPIVIICFKSEDGKSYHTWTGMMFKNYTRWKQIVDLFRQNKDIEIWLEGLFLKSKDLIDADSRFKVEIKELIETK